MFPAHARISAAIDHQSPSEGWPGVFLLTGLYCSLSTLLAHQKQRLNEEDRI